MTTKKIDYQKLFVELPGLYIILSTDFTIMDVSQRLAEAAETKSSDMIGKNLFEVFPENPNDLTADGQPNLKYSLNLCYYKQKHSHHGSTALRRKKC